MSVIAHEIMSRDDVRQELPKRKGGGRHVVLVLVPRVILVTVTNAMYASPEHDLLNFVF